MDKNIKDKFINLIIFFTILITSIFFGYKVFTHYDFNILFSHKVPIYFWAPSVTLLALIGAQLNRINKRNLFMYIIGL